MRRDPVLTVLRRWRLRGYTLDKAKSRFSGGRASSASKAERGENLGASMAGRIVSRPGLASRLDVEAGVDRRLGLSTLTVGLCAGAALLARPASAADLNANDQASFVKALNNAKNGDRINIAPDSVIVLTGLLPAVSKSITIDGNGSTISGATLYPGLTVTSGTVAINNLKIANTLAKGGDGGIGSIALGGGGGGGAGLGGALLILAGANVTATNITFQNNRAQGGNGGRLVMGNGGGGGYRTDGQAGTFLGVGGHGGLPGGGDGGNSEGILFSSGPSAQPGGFGGGGGGQGNKRDLPGAKGGFGGGGGSSTRTTSGGGKSVFAGGNGGGGNGTTGGGGGAGLGGAIFVEEGGSLTLAGAVSVSGNTAAGGAGGNGGGHISGDAGQGFGSGLFLQGNGSFALAPGAEQMQTIGDVIADQTGIVGSGGSWQLVKNGAGTTILTGANAYSGGTVINGGVLQGGAASVPGNIVDNASLVFDQTSDGTHTGSISGSGSLTKTGSGIVTQNGAATYSGSTIVNGGVLLLTSPLTASSGVTLNGGELGATGGGAMSLVQAVTIGSAAGSGFLFDARDQFASQRRRQRRPAHQIGRGRGDAVRGQHLQGREHRWRPSAVHDRGQSRRRRRRHHHQWRLGGKYSEHSRGHDNRPRPRASRQWRN
jgi:autotransporter-associated beta strand protein